MSPTICVGQAASAAAVLLAAGAPGKRHALPNARVLVHQPHGGAQGQSVDMEIAVAEMVEMRRRMVDILVDATGQSAERIATDMDRDFILRGDRARSPMAWSIRSSSDAQLADPMIAAGAVAA